jgi:hypothetical protein
MSATIGSIEHDVRVLLLDTDESGYRFSSYNLFCGIRDGIKRLNSVRPESRYFGLALVLIDFPAVDVDMTAEEIETVRDTVVLVEERWIEAVVFYALHKAYLIDSSDTANAALSADYLKKFEGIART